jgi:hypothetical protein
VVGSSVSVTEVSISSRGSAVLPVSEVKPSCSPRTNPERFSPPAALMSVMAGAVAEASAG